MTAWIALLRAVNVGGTGTLTMAALRELCVDAGLANVRTQGASGNAVFDTALTEAEIWSALSARLEALMGKPVGVILRTGADMAAVHAGNPFPDAEAKYTHAIFLPAPPPPDALDAIKGRENEELRLGTREIYVRYPSGQGRSRLLIPAARDGTARNMNTIARMAAMAAGEASA